MGTDPLVPSFADSLRTHRKRALVLHNDATATKRAAREAEADPLSLGALVEVIGSPAASSRCCRSNLGGGRPPLGQRRVHAVRRPCGFQEQRAVALPGSACPPARGYTWMTPRLHLGCTYSISLEGTAVACVKPPSSSKVGGKYAAPDAFASSHSTLWHMW